MPLFFLAQSKSPDYGARIYINASVAKPDQHVRIPPPSAPPPCRLPKSQNHYVFKNPVLTNVCTHIQGKFLRDYLSDKQYER